jgi:hypothetical protein
VLSNLFVAPLEDAQCKPCTIEILKENTRPNPSHGCLVRQGTDPARCHGFIFARWALRNAASDSRQLDLYHTTNAVLVTHRGSRKTHGDARRARPVKAQRMAAAVRVWRRLGVEPVHRRFLLTGFCSRCAALIGASRDPGCSQGSSLSHSGPMPLSSDNARAEPVNAAYPSSAERSELSISPRVHPLEKFEFTPPSAHFDLRPYLEGGVSELDSRTSEYTKWYVIRSSYEQGLNPPGASAWKFKTRK